MNGPAQEDDLLGTELWGVSSACPVTSARTWLEVKDVMSRGVASVARDVNALAAAQMMAGNGISSLLVTEHGRLVGILTETDLLEKVAGSDRRFEKIPVAEIMSSPVVSVSPSLSVLEAGRIMDEQRIKRLPIVHQEHLLGIVTQTDLVRALSSYGLWADVCEIMVADVVAISASATIVQAAEAMTYHNISCVIVGEGAEPVGILTKRDLFERVVARQKDPARTRIGQVMSFPVVSVPPHCSIFSAGKIMEKKNIRRLAVMEGRRLHGIVAQTDIFTAVKRKLQGEEEKNLAMLQRSRSAIFTANLNGMITYANPALLELLEVAQPGELVGGPFLPERFWFDREECRQFFSGFRNGDVETGELTLNTARNNRIWVTLAITRTKNVHGEINGSQGVLVDITDKRELAALRKAETALREAKHAAEAASRAKSSFLANMSHEIRSPMTAICGFTDFLAGRLEDSEDLQAVDTIRRNAKHLLKILNDVLDLSKIEAGKMTVEQTACSPCHIISEVVSLMRVQARAKGLTLSVEHQGPIPTTVTTDPTRLRQILTNLVDNAVKFTTAGSVRILTTLLEDNGQGSKLRFDVVDTGMGMKPEQLGSLFAPFTQADESTSRRFGGTGLGLAISRRLARLLGGDLTVASRAEEGSTFSLTIATGSLDGVTMADHPPEAVLTPGREKPAASAIKLDCDVLLLEDGPDNQRIISFFLEQAGARVTVAENGQIGVDKAMASLRGHSRRRDDPKRCFDIVLADMQMPVLDGYQATRQLRAQGFTRPIIALTAHALAGDRQKCIDAGCNDYMSKPINGNKLVKLVASYVNREPHPV